MNKSIERIEGPVFPIITPFKDDPIHDYPVDWEALEGYVDFLLEHGACHIMVASATSRFAQLTDDEIREINRIVTKRVGNKGVATASTGIQGSTRMHVETAKAAEKDGAQIIACEYPWRYQNDEALEGYFKTILEQTNSIKILLHVTPGRSEMGGLYRYDVPVLERISSHPRVIGMKEAAGDEALSRRIMAALAQKTSIVAAAGGSQAYLRGLSYGVSGFFVGTGNLHPESSLQIYSLGKEGRIKEAEEMVLQYETPFLKSAVKFGWHAALKAGLAELGLMSITERPPMVPINYYQRKELAKVMQECGWI